MQIIKKAIALIVIAFFASSLAFVMPASAATSIYYDGFNDATSNGWLTRYDWGDFDNPGVTTGNIEVDTTNHRLLMTVYSSANPSNAWGLWLHLKGIEETLQGNFMLQVKYELINWVTSPIMRVGLGHVASDGTHWYWDTYCSESKQYLVDAWGGETTNHPTGSGSTTGWMRVIRQDSVTWAYFKDSTHDWTYIGQSTQGTGDLLVQLGFWGGKQSFSGQNYQVAFDDLYVFPGIIFAPPELDSCDQYAAVKDTFGIGESIGLKGRFYDPGKTYDLYIVEDTTWTEGMPIPTDRVEDTVVSITADSEGTLRTPALTPTIVYASPVPGVYDLIIDVNDNGLYDAAIDKLLDNRVQVTGGLFVVPEYYLGAFLALVACFAAFFMVKRPSLNLKHI